MAQRIDTVQARARLAPRPSPYWHKLTSGASIGFRRLSTNAPGTWIVQWYDPATGKQVRRALGAMKDTAPSEQFSRARKAADDWLTHLGQGGSAESMTVAQACSTYLLHLRAEGKAASAEDAEARFGRWVTGTAIAGIELRRLAAHHLQAWRHRLISTPVTVNPHAPAEEQHTRKRSPASVNRDMAPLRAALNLARVRGVVPADAAWRVALKPIAAADRRRTLYLDKTQRAALIAKARPDVAILARGLALVPLRPGALAALQVSAIDHRLHVLTVGRDKHGAERRLTLPAATSEFFAGLAAGRPATAPLFVRADGKAWGKDAWKKPFKSAAVAAGLCADVTAYTFRHSIITDLIAAGLDVLTVARLSGTSLPMIERHYGHLRAAHAAKAMETLAI